MRYCKVKTTGEVIETQSGDGDLEMFYSNNSGQYSRDELEVGIADDAVVNGWLQEQDEAKKTYADKRREEYDQMGNQFEMIFDDQDVWRNKINEIKAKYPKE